MADSPFCPIDDVVELPFRKLAFKNTDAIEFMHDAPPRFGHHSDLGRFIAGDSDDEDDYIKGLLATSIAMFCFFSVWITILLILKCCGPKRVGFWSGRGSPLQPLPPKSGNESVASIASSAQEGAETEAFRNFRENLREWAKQMKASRRCLNICRVIVLCCGTAIIVNASLMVSKGITSLVKTLDGGRDVINLIGDLARQAIFMVDAFLETAEKARDDTVVLLEATNGFCPDVREELCTNVLNATNCNFTGIPYALELENLVDYFDGVKGLAFEEVVKFRADLVTMKDAADEMDNNAQNFNWAFWIAASFSLALSVLCFLMMICVVLVWVHKLPRVFHYFRMVVVVPCFIFLVLISWAFSMVFVIGSMATADMCIDSPDGIILKLVDKIRPDISSIIAEFLIFYISGCPVDAPPVTLDDELRFAKDAIPAFVDFVSTLRGAAIEIEGVCGRPPALIAAAADVVAGNLCKISLILREVRVYLNCDNWYPIYEGLIYETVCYDGTDGFAWVASTQFVIVFMTMIILTLRITFYEVEVEMMDEEEDEPADDDEDSLIIPPQASKEAPKAEDTTTRSQSDEPEQPRNEMVDSDGPVPPHTSNDAPNAEDSTTRSQSHEPEQPQNEMVDSDWPEGGQEQPIHAPMM